MKNRIAAIALVIFLVPAYCLAQRGTAKSSGSAATPAAAPGGRAAQPSGGQPTGAFHAAQSGHAAPSSGVGVRAPMIQRGWSSPVGRPPVNATGVTPLPNGGFISVGQGFGNINHPGGVLPPGMQPLPIVGQPLPGFNNGVVPVDGFRGHRRGNTVIVPVPVVIGGYSYYGYDGTAYPTYPSPNVIIVQPSSQGYSAEQPQQYYGPSTYAGSNLPPQQAAPDQASQPGSGIYVVGPSTPPAATPAPAADQPAQAQSPITLLVFKDHSIYAATDYWRQGDRLYYLTNYGTKNNIPLDQLDMDSTVQFNRERSVPFILAERQP